MVYFDSDLEKGVETHKKTYAKYPTFKIGLLQIILLVTETSYATYLLVQDILSGNIAIAIYYYVIAYIVDIFMILISIKIMLSGKKKQLVDIPEEVVSVYKDHVSIEQVPNGKKTKYILVRTNIYYCDIKEIRYESDKERICIIAVGQKEKYKQLDDESDYENRIIEEAKFSHYYIYNRYPCIKQILQQIEQESLHKAICM